VSGAHLLPGEHRWTNKCGTSVREFEGVGLTFGDLRPSRTPRKEAFVVIIACAVVGILIVDELIG